MTTERLTEIREWIQRHGPPGWTGTAGTAALMLRELLDSRERMRDAAATTCRELYLIGDAECVEIGERLDAAIGAA